MRRPAILIAILAALLFATSALAHEVRPAYLEITEAAPETYDILWKVPANGEYRLSLYVRLPASCTEISPQVSSNIDAAMTSRWRVRCAGGLPGKTVTIDGLVATYTDALARIVHADGTVQTTRITPDSPNLIISASPTVADTARTYFVLGVQHIMLGFDHLLFVLALLLLVRDTRTLLATITAFTVAHSITLAFAALGMAAVPQPPVEAMIALSIALVASEVVRKQRGADDLSGRYPWMIAFLFGLLHGFGFGGALREIGLPQKDVPMALLTFNLGVEAGQLIFVALVLLAIAGLKLLLTIHSERPRLLAAYLIGSIAAVWFVQRVTSFA